MSIIELEYERVRACPLCGSSSAAPVGKVTAAIYRFAGREITMPAGGVSLLRCDRCELLFKEQVPTAGALSHVMGLGATEVWKPSAEAHPLADLLRKETARGGNGVLDIGAANGDVLRALQADTPRRSAFDIVPYEACRPLVSDEYIIGQFEDVLEWSHRPYTLVTAFDVFEHFLHARVAVAAIAGFVEPGGHLVVETGDYEHAYPSIGRWYYTNLFEHTIFWNRTSIAFAAAENGLRVASLQDVNHKGRLALRGAKAGALELAHLLSRFGVTRELVRRVTGVDPGLLARPAKPDHMLVVLERP